MDGESVRGRRNVLKFAAAAPLIAFVFAAAIPVRAGDVRSHPNPAHTFADAVARARRMIAADDSVVADGGASILLTHGERTAWVAVLLHGLTDSPRQFASLADSLFAQGDNVLVPRLPRHAERGKNVGELARLTASELCASADNAVDIAAGLGDSVVVMGLSVGGTLAAWTAEHRAEVRRAVAIAPAFEVARIPSELERPLVNLGAHVPNVSRKSSRDSARPDFDPGFTTRGLDAVLRLGRAVQDDANRFMPSGEVSFVVNAHDHTVKTAPVLQIARQWRRRGVLVAIYEFPDSLSLPHNVIDPVRRATSVAPPVLLALARGKEPPRWLVRR